MSKIKRKIVEEYKEIPDSCQYRIRNELNNVLGYVPEKIKPRKEGYVRRKICIASLILVLMTGSAFAGYEISSHLIKTKEKENNTLEISLENKNSISSEKKDDVEDDSLENKRNVSSEKKTDAKEDCVEDENSTNIKKKIYNKYAITWHYLPQEFTDDYYWDTIMFREDWSVAGISASIAVYDNKDVTTVKNEMVESYEEITINNHEALLVNNIRNPHDNGFNKKLYIVYPEFQRIVVAWIGEKIDRNEVIRIFENAELYDTGVTGMYGEMTWKELAQFIH